MESSLLYCRVPFLFVIFTVAPMACKFLIHLSRSKIEEMSPVLRCCHPILFFLKKKSVIRPFQVEYTRPLQQGGRNPTPLEVSRFVSKSQVCDGGSEDDKDVCSVGVLGVYIYKAQMAEGLLHKADTSMQEIRELIRENECTETAV